MVGRGIKNLNVAHLSPDKPPFRWPTNGHGTQSGLSKENIPPSKVKASEAVTLQMSVDSRTSPLSCSTFPNRRCDPSPFSTDQGVETDMDTESEIPPRKLNFSNDEMEHSFSNHFKDLGSYSDQSDGDSDDEFIGESNYETVDDEELAVNVVKEYATLRPPSV
ncbi:hypothetical protein ACET3Z_013278 [Daucus carota]